MRGSDAVQEALFMFSKLDDFVPTDHPLRAIQKLVNESPRRPCVGPPPTGPSDRDGLRPW